MSELPYNGDINKARQAGDGRAIRLIMEWNRVHPPKVIEEEVPEMPEEARLCVNKEDYILQEPWSSDHLPTIHIRYMDFAGRIGPPMCYREDDLTNLIEECAWVIPYRNAELYFDDDGKVRSPFNIDFKGYGEPSTVEKFVRVSPAYYLEETSFNREMGLSNSLLAVPIYKTRLGNPEGSYGESRSHGQGPSTTVYYVVDYDDFLDIPETVYEVIYKRIYNLKTDVYLSDEQISGATLPMIIKLQRDYPVAQKDLDFYNNRLPPQQYRSRAFLMRLPHVHDLTSYNIINAMNDWMDHPSEEQLVRNRFFQACYEQYVDQHKVIEYKEDDFFHTATFVDGDIHLMAGYDRYVNFYDILTTYLYYPSSYFSNMPLYDDINMFLGARSNFRFGAMLQLLTNSFNKGLLLWIYHLEGPITSVIFGSIFEASRINTNEYKLINGWRDLSESLIRDIILFIFEHPIICHSLYERYYLNNYRGANIFNIYRMYYFLFELGIPIPGRSSNNIRDLIVDYSETEILMDFIKTPSLYIILDGIISARLNISNHIRNRMDEIEETQTIIFKDQFHYSGVTELDNFYKEPSGLGPNEFMMMFYTDPSFADLIGPYNLRSNQIQNLKEIIRKSGYLLLGTELRPLHEAVRQGYEDIVVSLLKYGADPNEIDGSGNISLWYIGNKLDILQLLIDKGVDLNFQNMEAETILHYAVTESDETMVRMLLQAGADPNIQDFNGNTPLHNSVPIYPEMTKLLLEYNADPNITNNYEETADDISRRYKPLYRRVS